VVRTPFARTDADEANGNASRERERHAVEAKRNGTKADQEDENKRGENHVHLFRLLLTINLSIKNPF